MSRRTFSVPKGNYLGAEGQYPPHGADEAVGVPELLYRSLDDQNVANIHLGSAENLCKA